MPAIVKHCVHSFYTLKVCAGRKLCLSVQRPVQLLFRQTKNADSFQSKISQKKSSKFRNGEIGQFSDLGVHVLKL